MIEVEVLIDSFHDKENYNKKIIVNRNGKEIEVEGKLLFKGDKYKISKERYKELSELKIVSKVTESKNNQESRGE